MTLRLDAETRARAAALKAELRAIEGPTRKARKAEQKAARDARPAREQRISHDTGKKTRGRVLDKGYLAWLRRLPCAAGAVVGGCEGPIEAAHLRYSDASRGRINPGLSTKPSDRYATPLYAAYQAGADGAPIILQFATQARARRAA